MITDTVYRLTMDGMTFEGNYRETMARLTEYEYRELMFNVK